MKKGRLIVFLAPFLFFQLASGDETSKNISETFGNGVVVQVGIVVKDIEKAIRAYADFLGVEPPAWFLTDSVDVAHTVFQGKPTEARAKLAFFELKNITLELIEPVGGPSTWREFLETQGEGVHHLAFEIKGMDEKASALSQKGMTLLQKGDYEGGRYSYIDGRARLGVILELLENF